MTRVLVDALGSFCRRFYVYPGFFSLLLLHFFHLVFVISTEHNVSLALCHSLELQNRHPFPLPGWCKRHLNRVFSFVLL